MSGLSRLIIPSRRRVIRPQLRPRWRWRSLLGPFNFLGGPAGGEHEPGHLSSRWRPWSPLMAVHVTEIDMSDCPCCEACDCEEIPDTLTATVVAVSGGCGAGFIGSSATLTEAGLGTPDDEQWAGVFNSQLTNVSFSCGDGGANPACLGTCETALALQGGCGVPSSCTPHFSSGACRVCWDGTLPFFASHVFTFPGSSLCCFGGGTMTIEVTE